MINPSASTGAVMLEERRQQQQHRHRQRVAADRRPQSCEREVIGEQLQLNTQIEERQQSKQQRNRCPASAALLPARAGKAGSG